jgi:RNase adaptor protein for sRNA GlmZ degradation
MRGFGFLLVAIGFLGGALISVLNETAVRWEWFAAAVAVGAVGLVLIRMSRRQHVHSTERLVFNMQAIEESLSRIAENMTRLNADKRAMDPYDVRHRIEELFADDLTTFVEARESIVHSYGLTAYADVMSCFAAGERYLNRVWCASADGYVDEIDDYLERAREQFAASLEKVLSLQAGSRPV